MDRHPLITTLEEEFNRECDKDYYKNYFYIQKRLINNIKIILK